MIKNYFIIAWRNLVKNKAFTIINVLGLTVGLTSFILIALYIFDELTFDGFHKKGNAIYRIIESKNAENKTSRNAGTAYQISQKAKAELPEVKDFATLTTFGRNNVSNLENKNVFNEYFIVANSNFLNVFDFELLAGNKQTALTLPHSIIITEATAIKFFGTQNALGKLLNIDNDSVPFKITAVLKDIPKNSHLTFNLLVSEKSMAEDDYKKFISSDWKSSYYTTYFLLNENSNVKKIETWMNTTVSSSRGVDDAKSTFELQALSDIHFYSKDIVNDDSEKGNVMYIYIFSTIAFFVLLIACINYMNLTTARFSNRTKEIAMRKVSGASRLHLVIQFFSEALILTLVALVFSIGFVKLILPAFNTFTSKSLTLDFRTDIRIWLGMVLILLITGLLSGIYPSLYQSRQNPLLLLKNKVDQGSGNLSMRQSLVVFQFALSIVMIVATILVYLQMQYLNNKDLGFDKKQLMVIDINSGDVRRGADVILSEFGKLPQVNKVSVSSRVPGEWKNIPKVSVFAANAPSDQKELYYLGIDNQFLSTYQINLVKGRDFMKGTAVDSSAVLINESAAKLLGINAPSEQLLDIPSIDFDVRLVKLKKPIQVRVIGIVKDFNFQSLRTPVAPMLLAYHKNPLHKIDYFTVKLEAGNTAATIAKMDAILRKIDTEHLFEYHFLEDQLQLFYQQDLVRQAIFLIFAVLTIIIACLGLFGLATYSAEQRIKEIGIRKVLGASVGGIVLMLSKDFLKSILIALIIASPIAWWSMNLWLQDFAYHVNIQIWVFIAAGALAIMIALITISFQAIKAAIANPIQSLRTE